MIRIKNNNSLPKRLFIQITNECNLKCKLCKLWKTQDLPEKISLDDKITFLKKVIKWLGIHKKGFLVHLGGGEPFLYPDQVFKLSKICKDNNIECTINTNGTLLKTNMHKILKSGITEINISIDSHIPEIHDNLRGRIGLFKQVTTDVKELIEYRNKYDSIKIQIASIIGDWNIRRLYDHINFLKNLGVDGIRFQPIQYTYDSEIRAKNNWYENFDQFPHSHKDIQNVMNYILELKQGNNFVLNLVEEIKLWGSYFKNPEYIPNIDICKAFRNNIIVDLYGNIKYCFWHHINPINKIGNIVEDSIEKIWNGKVALQVKKQMRKCSKGCGLLNCNS